jgi:nucleotide-binding universal stress UspA family protein
MWLGDSIGGNMMTRILVPTDFSEPSLAAVRYSIELATAVGGGVVLLHVVEGASVHSYAVGGPPLSLMDMIDPTGDFSQAPFSLCERKFVRRDLCEEARWKLDALVPPGYRARVHTVVTGGRAVDEIVRVAKEQHTDLILLGVRGRRRWWPVLRRTMADRVRRKAEIPVVTLDADDLRVAKDLGRGGVPDQGIGSKRAVAHRAELAHSARRDERGGRHADRRSRATHV